MVEHELNQLESWEAKRGYFIDSANTFIELISDPVKASNELFETPLTFDEAAGQHGCHACTHAHAHACARTHTHMLQPGLWT